MNKKRIRQMTGSLLRRLTTQPAARYLAPHRAMLEELLEGQSYLQRFVPLYDGTRISCGRVLALCQAELDRRGWVRKGAGWHFGRYICPRCTTPDAQGNVILDYGVPLASGK